MREQVIERIRAKKIITIVRGVYGEQVAHLAEALAAGGVELMEVTFDQSDTAAHAQTAAAIHAVSVTADCSYEESIIPEMSALLGDAYRKVRRLDEALMGAKTVEGSQALANYYRDKVFSAMAELRITIDQLETMTPSDKWPVPSYGDLLFSVR